MTAELLINLFILTLLFFGVFQMGQAYQLHKLYQQKKKELDQELDRIRSRNK